MRQLFSNIFMLLKQKISRTSGVALAKTVLSWGLIAAVLFMLLLEKVVRWLSSGQRRWRSGASLAVGLVMILVLIIAGCAGHLKGAASGSHGETNHTGRGATLEYSLEVEVDLQELSTQVKPQVESWFQTLKENISRIFQGSESSKFGMQNRR